MATDSESTMLTAADRIRARDAARLLLTGLETALASDRALDMERVRDIAAAIRDLDAVSRGPL